MTQSRSTPKRCVRREYCNVEQFGNRLAEQKSNCVMDETQSPVPIAISDAKSSAAPRPCHFLRTSRTMELRSTVSCRARLSGVFHPRPYIGSDASRESLRSFRNKASPKTIFIEYFDEQQPCASLRDTVKMSRDAYPNREP